MEIIYLPKAEEDLEFWIKSGNKTILKKIAQLTESVIEQPWEGIGKPEPLSMILQENGQEEFPRSTDLYIPSLRIHFLFIPSKAIMGNELFIQ